MEFHDGKMEGKKQKRRGRELYCITIMNWDGIWFFYVSLKSVFFFLEKKKDMNWEESTILNTPTVATSVVCTKFYIYGTFSLVQFLYSTKFERYTSLQTWKFSDQGYYISTIDHRWSVIFILTWQRRRTKKKDFVERAYYSILALVGGSLVSK